MDGDSGVVVEVCGDEANGCFDVVFAGSDSIEVVKGLDEADHAVSAHVEVADVVEEDDACGVLWVPGFAEECADHDL